jgi:hypothetical protein
MTIDRMDTRVDVTPSAGSGGGSGSLPGPSAPTPAQGTQELLAALRPLVIQIIDSELQMRLRIAGLR